MDTKESIVSLLNSLEREGKEKIIDYLEGSTFFTDPASCSEYNAYEGGLAEHSLNVYQILSRNCSLHPELEKFKESVIIMGLLHDVGAIGTFQKVSKNVTVKGPDGRNRLKENGKLFFVEKDGFDPLLESQLPYPKGTLSTVIIKQHLKLSKLEDLAIHWHLGIYDQPYNMWGILKRAQKTHKLIFMLYSAKREACLFHDTKVITSN